MTTKTILAATIGLILAAHAPAWGQVFRHKALSHATDCTSLTGNKANQFCYELDSNNWYVCEPTSGDCDTAGEWILVASTTSSGGWTDSGSTVALTTSTDDVGMGTALPKAPLHVLIGGTEFVPLAGTAGLFQSNAASGDTVFISMISGDTGNSQLMFGSAGAGQFPGRIIYDPTLATMDFRTNDLRAMLIDGSQLIGFGTDFPNSKAHVIGGLCVESSDTNCAAAAGLIVTEVGLDAVGAADLDYGSGDVTDHTFLTDGTGTGEMVLPAQAIDSTEILNDTIVPADVDETADYSFVALSGKQLRFNTAVSDDDCTGDQSKWWYDTTDGRFEFCNANTGAPAILAGGGGAGAFSDAADPVVLQSVGKDVVIGASHINTSKLAIDGDADQVQVTIQGHSTQNADLFVIENSGGTELLNFSPSGLLGIGISSPDATLHVHTGSAGAVSPDVFANDLVVEVAASGGISILVPDANSGALVFGSPADATGGNLTWRGTDNELSLGTRKTGADLKFKTGDNVDAMIILDDGTICIGCTTPFSLLDLSDPTQSIFTLHRVDTSIVSGNSIGIINFAGDDPSITRAGARIEAKADGEWGTAGDTTDAPTRLHFSTVPDGSGTLIGAMVIRESGNIGIGTNEPNTEMEVNGVLTLTPKASAPATCAIGAFYSDTSGASCACTSTNTWTNMHGVGSCV